MSWENPVTTWGQAGKTVPGAGDFNRIEGNTQYLKDEVDLHKEDETAHITPDERNDWNSKAAGSHNHDASDINTGTLPIARGGTGGTSVTTARNNLGVAQTRVYNGKLQYYDGGWKDVGEKVVKSSLNAKHTVIGSTPVSFTESSASRYKVIGKFIPKFRGTILIEGEVRDTAETSKGYFTITVLRDKSVDSYSLVKLVENPNNLLATTPVGTVIQDTTAFDGLGNMSVQTIRADSKSSYKKGYYEVQVDPGTIIVFTIGADNGGNAQVRNIKICYDELSDDFLQS